MSRAQWTILALYLHKAINAGYNIWFEQIYHENTFPRNKNSNKYISFQSIYYHQLFAFFEINSGGGTSFPDFLRILLYINSGICCGLCLGIVMSRWWDLEFIFWEANPESTIEYWLSPRFCVDSHLGQCLRSLLGRGRGEIKWNKSWSSSW